MAGIDGFTKLVLHCDGTNGSTTFTDSSPAGHTVLVGGNAQISTAQSVFGGASAAFDGAGDFLALDISTDFVFGTGDFTIDFRVRPVTSTTMCFVDCRDANLLTPSPVIYKTVTDNLLRFNDGLGDQIVGTALSNNTWYHVALARAAGSTRMFLDGTQVGSTFADANNYVLGVNRPLLGAFFDGAQGPTNGWMDEIRISKGIARWTANFTPPAAAYTPEIGVEVATQNMMMCP